MSELVPSEKFSRLPERYQRRAKDIAVRVREIDALMAPAEIEVVIAVVVRMASQFRAQPDEDQTVMGKEYREACRDLPTWAISEAANDFLAGRVESHTGQFMPTCAEFAKRARNILLPFLAERSALRIEASKLIERAEDDHRRHLIEIERQDPAVRKRVAALVENVMAGAPKQIPMRHTGLDAEKQKRIDALKKPRQFDSKITQTRIGKQG